MYKSEVLDFYVVIFKDIEQPNAISILLSVLILAKHALISRFKLLC